MMRFLHLLLLPLFVAACSGTDSSMTTGPAIPPVEKPTACKMDFAQTCWSKTVEKITSCLPQMNTTSKFTTDKEFCLDSKSNQLVYFESPVDLFTHPFEAQQNPIKFKVYPESTGECFSVSGTKNDFTVYLKQTGETVHFRFDQKEMAFNCLDGQEVKISADKINGCENVMSADEMMQQIPGFVLDPIVIGAKERGWRFRFSGAPQSQDVFKCLYQ